MEQDEQNSEPMSQQADSFIWKYFRTQLEQNGKGEAGLYLKHYLKTRLQAVEEVEGVKTFKFDMFHNISDFSVKLNAMNGDLMGWYFDLYAKETGADIPSDEALMIAKETAEPPKNAVLSIADYEDVAGNPVFVARWIHKENNIPVERDYIHILINGNKGCAFALYKKWHEIDLNFSER